MSLRNLFFPVLLLILSAVISSCRNNYSPEEKQYIDRIKNMRTEKNRQMENDPYSPFNHKRKVHFENLKYYDVDPSYVFKSRLFEFDKKDTVVVYGTKGEERKAVKYGYVKINHKGTEYKVNVYQGTSSSGEIYYSIWFTDKTTNDETYGVGRYLDFELNNDKDYIYTIDFNQAYNPYCAYSPEYSCAIPTRDDHIDMAIRAGEKKFHN